jgi:hypothetical protein
MQKDCDRVLKAARTLEEAARIKVQASWFLMEADWFLPCCLMLVA